MGRAIGTMLAAAAGLVLAGNAVAQVGSQGRAVFISPMGEPFRGASAKLMERRWFDGADTNHDGSLSLAEMQADAARLFVVLNRNGDGEIDPGELSTYENEIAPEVRVGATVIEPDAGTGEGGESSQVTIKHSEPRQGAGRFGLLAAPNPVASADTNFNRGISADEFARAARTRFGLLDVNHDGRLGFDELPALPSRYSRL